MRHWGLAGGWLGELFSLSILQLKDTNFTLLLERFHVTQRLLLTSFATLSYP